MTYWWQREEDEPTLEEWEDAVENIDRNVPVDKSESLITIDDDGDSDD